MCNAAIADLSNSSPRTLAPMHFRLTFPSFSPKVASSPITSYVVAMKLSSSLLLALTISSSCSSIADARLRRDEADRHHIRRLKKDKKKGGGGGGKKEKDESDDKSAGGGGGGGANRNYYVAPVAPPQTAQQQGVTNYNYNYAAPSTNNPAGAGNVNYAGITNYVPSSTQTSSFYQGQPQIAGAQYAYGFDPHSGRFHPGLDPNTHQLNQYASNSRDPGNNGYGGTPPCAGTRGGCYSQTGAYYPNGVPAQQQTMPATQEQAVISRAGAGYEDASATKIATFDTGSAGTVNVWRVRPSGMDDEPIDIGGGADSNRAADAAAAANVQVSPVQPVKSNIPTWPYTSYPYVALPPFDQQCEAHEQCQSGCCVLNIVGTCMDAGRCA